jgi:hypothetical protein
MRINKNLIDSKERAEEIALYNQPKGDADLYDILNIKSNDDYN